MDATSADRHPAYLGPLPAVTAKEGVAAGRPNDASSLGTSFQEGGSIRQPTCW